MNANADKLEVVTLYKKSHKGNYFSKKANGKDWKSDKGYDCRPVSTSERQQQNVQGLQKLQAVKQFFPNNPALDKIVGKKMLEFADVNPDEVKEVLDAQEQMMKAPQVGAGSSPDALQGSPQPANPQPQLTPPQNVLQPA
jgi:hypothetical protein